MNFLKNIKIKKFRSLLLPGLAVFLIINANIGNKKSTVKVLYLATKDQAYDSCKIWEKEGKEGDKLKNGYILTFKGCLPEIDSRQYSGVVMKRKILETIPLIPIIKEDERKGIPIDNEKSRFTKLSNKCESWANNQRKKFPKENTIYFKSFDCVVYNHSFVFKKVIQDRVRDKVFKW